MRIRAAVSSDLETIVEFNAAMARETEHLELDRDTLRRGVGAALADPAKGIYFVAENDGRVVGQLMITHEWSDWRDGDLWWIQSVYVHAGARRSGVFRALYAHATAAARAAGAVGIRLYVERDNTAAQRVYERLGMRLTRYLVMEQLSKARTTGEARTTKPE